MLTSALLPNPFSNLQTHPWRDAEGMKKGSRRHHALRMLPVRHGVLAMTFQFLTRLVFSSWFLVREQHGGWRRTPSRTTCFYQCFLLAPVVYLPLFILAHELFLQIGVNRPRHKLPHPVHRLIRAQTQNILRQTSHKHSRTSQPRMAMHHHILAFR